MAKGYRHLSLEDRKKLAELHRERHTSRQIADDLGCAPSTVSRELRRNRYRTHKSYGADAAHGLAKDRRARPCRLECERELREEVMRLLRLGHSPEQVSGRLARERGGPVIHHSSIYRFIAAQKKRTDDRRWDHLLPGSTRPKRRRHDGRTFGSQNYMKNRVSIHERPESCSNRSECGHWEADTVHAPDCIMLMLHERRSRFDMSARLESKDSDSVAKAMRRLLARFPAELRKSVTMDNGSEFVRHERLHELGIDTYFCDPHSPHQKGGVEHANRRFREFFSRKTPLKKVSRAHFQAVMDALNNTPRKCLGYRTSAEVMLEQVLHFGCKLSPPLSRGSE